MDVLIIYGSTGGNTELVVDQVSGFLCESGLSVVCRKVERFKFESLVDEIKQAKVLILASPTYGHGQLQEDIIPFVQRLDGMEFPDLHYTVIGLGDPKYDSHYHIESAVILESIMESLKAKKLLYPLRISRSPVLQIDNLIPKWSQKFSEEFLKI